MSKSFPRIEAAAIDGRLHNIYHRQVQLERLCKALIDSAEEITKAISNDSGHSHAEVAVEYHLALKAVKDYYALLKPQEAHKQEYLIADSQDSPHNRIPFGVAYIEPTSHTLFYSAVVPLAAALAAGNCVILLLENNLRSVSSILRRLLSAALDADTFAIASASVTDEQLLSKTICVLQNGSQHDPSFARLVSCPQSLTVAVVDRTADVKAAARHLVTARFSFGGRSPYAPDVVLVNEFTKEKLLTAISEECTRRQWSASISHSTDGITPENKNRLSVIDTDDREKILNKKTETPTMVLHAIKSLDDAIDLISSKVQGPCLAAYHFGNPATGKYLSQFIDSEVSFINHIPTELLIGPAAPSGHPILASHRYPIDLFTMPRSAYIHSTGESGMLASVLEEGETSAKELIRAATMPLVAFKRNPGGGVGFFEQGFLINAGLILASTLTVTVTGLVYAWKWTRAQ